ncbi:peptidoglycan-binding domain-containing protein [Streptomyces sp. KLOTTS4A1]|uniref:peptidoglycan-binding domain-containing protein n=1 Tax=Streptomyces sp. KLOTTS4A1 TaxID=3390996 RepID=UPI0039F4788E
MSRFFQKPRKLALTVGALTLAMTAAGTAMAPSASAVRYYPECVDTISIDKGWYTLVGVPFTDHVVACSLMYGDSGKGVEGLQRLLNRCYGKNLVPDGVFGTRTREALISAQKAINTTPDGVYGPETAQLIKKRAINDSLERWIACRAS